MPTSVDPLCYAQQSPQLGYHVRVQSAPLIAVSAANTPDKRGFERASLNLSYLRAIESAGGIPLVVAPGMPRSHLESALERCAALILTGGGDVDPARYAQQPHDSIVGVSPSRDDLEFAALEIAAARGLPVLAICRGMQVLNVWSGGALIQDIPTMVEGACAHSVQHPREAAAHPVAVEPASRLAAILGATDPGVNSRHHQALDPARLGANLIPVAHAPDGVIEGIELPGDRFVVGVQWHPEDMAAAPGDHPDQVAARNLFAALVEDAR